MGTHYQGSVDETTALDTYIKLSRAADAVSARVNGHLDGHGITTSQFGVLEALYHLGPMQVGRLGTKILRSSGNMTLVVDNLEKRGLVRRQRRDDDRRCIDVHLTDSGRDLLISIWPIHLDHVVAAFNVLSRPEQDILAALCKRLGRAQTESDSHA